MAYHRFKADDGTKYGSFEVFHVEPKIAKENSGVYQGPGWYWWACFPGCMPEGGPTGPFKSEEFAIMDAQNSNT